MLNKINKQLNVYRWRRIQLHLHYCCEYS